MGSVRHGFRANGSGTAARILHVVMAGLLMLAVLPGGFTTPAPAGAAGGDYSLDFVAAAPFVYDHAIGGGAFNDRTVGKTDDIVESLEGGDFACGERVTYLTEITVDDLSDGASPAGIETIELEFTLGAEATNGVSVGHIDVVTAEVNYGPVVNGAGPGGTDSGMSDDLGSAATIVFEQYTSGASPDGSYPDPQEDDLIVRIQIDDLESFESVILRFDALLGCGFGSIGTGNIQAKLSDARVVESDGQPVDDPIPGGAQTIPFKSVSNEELIAPSITVIKSNDADGDGTFSDTETAPVGVPVTVTYQVAVTNDSPDAVEVSSVDDDTHAIVGSSCAGLVGTIIGSGATVTCTFDATFTTDDQSVTNVFSVTAFNDGGEASDADDSTVIIPDLLPVIDVTKAASPTSVPETGGDVTYTVMVDNDGPEGLLLTSLVDDMFGDLDGAGTCAVPQSIVVGGTYSCEFTQFVSGDAGTSHVNVVTGTGSDDDGNEVSDADDATVGFVDELPAIEVTKTASPVAVPESGGDVTYSVMVANDGPEVLLLTSLVDDMFGDLDGAGTCSVPQSIVVGGTYSCEFTETVAGPAGSSHVNVVTATGSDDDDNEVSDTDDASVLFIDEIPVIDVTKAASPTSVPETGGDVTYTVMVDNDGPEGLLLTSLVDDMFGDLDGVGTCAVPQSIVVGGTYSCEFTQFVSGDAGTSHVNVVTGTGSDDDGNEVSDADDATVGFVDELPAIEVTKTASPVAVPESGGDVTYSVMVANDGPEVLLLTSLVDDMFGDLDGAGTCSVPQSIVVGGTYSCEFTETVAGPAGSSHVNVVTATGSDDDDNEVSDTDDASVLFIDEIPVIDVTKAASPTSVPETGGDVTYTVMVDNDGPEGLLLTSLVDDMFGDLDGVGTCSVPQSIVVGGTYSCEFTQFVSGDAGTSHVNVVTGTGSDDDGNEVSDADDATVGFVDELPAIEVTKTASPVAVPESGGDVTYSVMVANDGPEVLLLTSLVDDMFGDLDGAGTCSVPQSIVVGGTYSCEFTETVAGPAGSSHVNVVTATGSDDDDNEVSDTDDASVLFIDEIPVIDVTKAASPTSVPETGGDVTYTVMVDNDGPEGLLLTSLVDDMFGDLDGVGTCAVPQSIVVGGTYSCEFTQFVSGDAGTSHVNVVTGTGSDDDGNEVSDADDATVGFVDELPAIEVTKTASPVAVPESGGDVTYSVMVANDGPEVLLLTSLVDDMFGDLDGAGTCSVPQSIVVGGTYSCEFTETVAGPAGSSHVNVVTATGSDDDDNEVSDTDDASVLFIDEIPVIDVTKAASPTSVPETGGDVTYTVTVENIGETDITLESIVDDIFGDLDGVGTCAVPQELLEGATYTCEFTQFVTGNAGVDHVNVVTVSGTDEGGDEVSDADDETVELEAIIDLEVTKVVAPGTVAPGENATWTMTVINQGPSNASGVELTDVAESGLTYVSHTGDGTFDPATGVWVVGELAVGERATLELVTTVEDAGAFTNTIEVTAADQEDIDSVPGDGQGDDFAAATVLSVAVLAAGTIGDFVWRDTDADGVQDEGEKGIPGARVVLTNLDTDVVVSMTTNDDGLYLFSALVAGNYRVSVDRSTVSGALTTPGTYTLFLAESENSLDNDFGFAEKLPETGAELGDFALVGALLVLFGMTLVLAPRRRRTD